MVMETPFALTTPLGWPLRGDVRSPDTPGSGLNVVICHGFKGFKDWGFFPEVGRRLAAAGHTAISFNFAGNGIGANPQEFSEAERFRRNTLSLELGDLELVLDTLAAGRLPGLSPRRSSGAVLLGHSRGGLIAVVAATRRPDIRGLVTWNGVGQLGERFPEALRAEWRRNGKLDVVNSRTGQVLEMGMESLDDIEAHLTDYDPVTLAPAISSPWLIIHGMRDLTVPFAEAEALAMASVTGRTHLHPIEGGDHTLGIIHPYQKSSAQLDEAVNRTLEFLDSPEIRASD